MSAKYPKKIFHKDASGQLYLAGAAKYFFQQQELYEGKSYAEYEKDNILYQIWLEDMDSMQRRLDAMREFDLGGVAGWRLGLEKPEVWNILGAYTRG